MHIVADADILSVEENFADLGELTLLPGREISNRDLRNADVLLVRSITAVNRQLLEGSPVKLVGTATSGVDHVDQRYLQDQGIAFCTARGCNANAVVDYCFAALADIAIRRQEDFFTRRFAIVGAGHVGGLFADRLSQLGIACLIHDPLLDHQAALKLQQSGAELVDLGAALAADVVSLHVPLTRTGSHPTWHLLDGERLHGLPQNCVLLNTSRGAVVDNTALASALQERTDLSVVLDVWEHEPDIDIKLLGQVALGTPHIAGYSLEAKLKASYRLREQVCQFIQRDLAQRGPGQGNATEQEQAVGSGLLESQERHIQVIDSSELDPADSFCAGILGQVLPVSGLSERMRAEFQNSGRAPAVIFDSLRSGLRNRREYQACQLKGSVLLPRQRSFLQAMGFGLSPD